MPTGSSAFSFSSNIFGFIAGGISLLGFVVALWRSHLPSNKIKTLEILVHETENTFKEAVEDGLLVPEFIERTEHRLTVLKERTCDLRARAYSATTLWKDYTEFLSGASKAIGRACQSAKNLRAEVITSSEERRHILRQIGSAPRISQAVPVPAPSQNTTPSPNSSASTSIPRPRSCPPILPAWSSANTPKAPVERESDPFGDASRSDSDVWIANVQI